MKRKTLLKILIASIFIELLFVIGLKAYFILNEEEKKVTSVARKTPVSDSEVTSSEEPPEEESPDSQKEKEEESSSDEADFITVDSSYFEDALFIGDSRTVALRSYGTFPDSFYFAKTGIGLNSLFELPASDEFTGKTLRHTLSERLYSKIYIMIGINDLSYLNLNDFGELYLSAIKTIREFQPNALIYVQSIIGITKQKETNTPNTFNNQTVLNRNALLKAKCDEENLIYLDLFSVFADTTGYLKPEYSSDGLHLDFDYYPLWENFLKTHALRTS